jgi:DNA-binding NarL/FixJ family response regulator
MDVVLADDEGVLILDWELPGLRARDTLRALAATSLGLRVIAISGLPEARRAALDAGADAFVSKGDPPEELLRIVHTVSGGLA